ncbi:hypothetical protein ml_139 [Mollivirus sibericum]|uniref:hypothetical protein n=1 Tax=Mollivirus sibericum TaxID=1678078 RepID=UPI0006B2E9F9|nr:hypothetical protein ml_139 [Mollivirus sibericum]ALD61941.1 hypothetical protein ml_139 [Mollivirus sibericum]
MKSGKGVGSVEAKAKPAKRNSPKPTKKSRPKPRSAQGERQSNKRRSANEVAITQTPAKKKARKSKVADGLTSLDGLPLEIILHVAGYLNMHAVVSLSHASWILRCALREWSKWIVDNIAGQKTPYRVYLDSHLKINNVISKCDGLPALASRRARKSLRDRISGLPFAMTCPALCKVFALVPPSGMASIHSMLPPISDLRVLRDRHMILCTSNNFDSLHLLADGWLESMISSVPSIVPVVVSCRDQSSWADGARVLHPSQVSNDSIKRLAHANIYLVYDAIDPNERSFEALWPLWEVARKGGRVFVMCRPGCDSKTIGMLMRTHGNNAVHVSSMSSTMAKDTRTFTKREWHPRTSSSQRWPATDDMVELQEHSSSHADGGSICNLERHLVIVLDSVCSLYADSRS